MKSKFIIDNEVVVPASALFLVSSMFGTPFISIIALVLVIPKIIRRNKK